MGVIALRHSKQTTASAAKQTTPKAASPDPAARPASFFRFQSPSNDECATTKPQRERWSFQIVAKRRPEMALSVRFFLFLSFRVFHPYLYFLMTNIQHPQNSHATKPNKKQHQHANTQPKRAPGLHAPPLLSNRGSASSAQSRVHRSDTIERND